MDLFYVPLAEVLDLGIVECYGACRLFNRIIHGEEYPESKSAKQICWIADRLYLTFGGLNESIPGRGKQRFEEVRSEFLKVVAESEAGCDAVGVEECFCLALQRAYSTDVRGSAKADALLASVGGFSDPPSQAPAHRNLRSAAAACCHRHSPPGHLGRFISAGYANDVARLPVPPEAEADKPYPRELLRDTSGGHGIEYAPVCSGIFMDFFLPKGKKKYFPDMDGQNIVAIDAEARPVDVLVPGSREDRASMGLADDLGRAMVRLSKVPMGGWQEYAYFRGDGVGWEEAAEISEEVSGERARGRTWIYRGCGRGRKRREGAMGR
ncbi:hypothetical protein DL765_009006 [Monosporascus sp. GIB2]|nr:hypothetical protein DL765_009006 [Monosporascus sp. GIB2]